MGRWQTIVTRVKSTVGATTDADARAWVLDAARRLNGETQYLTISASLGVTVAGQAEYSLPADIVDLAAVRVGTVVYSKASPNDIWGLEDTGNPATLVGNGGLFAPAWSSTGVPKIELYPVPTAAGTVIEGRQVITIPEPTVWATEDPPLPSDFDTALWHGAVASGLAEKDEDLAAAEWHENRFAAAANRLQRRKNSRIGSGAVRMRVPARDNW
jgi:hypothetical protein